MRRVIKDGYLIYENQMYTPTHDRRIRMFGSFQYLIQVNSHVLDIAEVGRRYELRIDNRPFASYCGGGYEKRQSAGANPQSSQGPVGGEYYTHHFRPSAPILPPQRRPATRRADVYKTAIPAILKKQEDWGENNGATEDCYEFAEDPAPIRASAPVILPPSRKESAVPDMIDLVDSQPSATALPPDLFSDVGMVMTPAKTQALDRGEERTEATNLLSGEPAR